MYYVIKHIAYFAYGGVFIKTEGCFYWVNKIKSEFSFDEASFDKLPDNIYSNENTNGFDSLFIAHATGQIDNIIYTNSNESIEKSIEDGFELIEADISLTSDGNFVLRHSWADDLNQDSISSKNIPTLDQFKNTPIYETYTPLSLDDYFRKVENSNIYTVLHLKLSSYNEGSEFAKYINDLESYNNISNKIYFLINYTDVFYGMCSINSQFDDNFILWIDNDCLTKEQFNFIVSNNIIFLTVPSEDVEIDKMLTLVNKGYRVYVYTCDDLGLANELISEGIGIYSNFLSPEVYNFCFE